MCKLNRNGRSAPLSLDNTLLQTIAKVSCSATTNEKYDLKNNNKEKKNDEEVFELRKSFYRLENIK